MTPIKRFRDVPMQIGGYVLAETSWGRCLRLVEDLGQLGVPAYSPVIRERWRSSRGRGVLEVWIPAFGGYFWIANRRDIVIPWVVAAQFRRFYRDGFFWFSDEEIEDLRAQESGWPALNTDAPRIHLAKGTNVEVIAGPFQGHTGSVQSDQGARVRVTLGRFTIDLPPFMVRQMPVLTDDGAMAKSDAPSRGA